jgi:Xaa-Pro aminopeptidase
MFYFAKGDKVKPAAENFSDQVGQAFKQRGKNTKKLAIDKIMLDGFKSLENRDFKIENGEKIMEHARSIKSTEEIKAMRCSISACETSMHIMESKTKPGMTENDIWSILHSENIKRGGEWIETRLLSSGTKTNPWFQECGSRILQNNEIVAFDTDLVGCYSMCTDISRTWWVGDKEPTNEMKEDYRIALDHIQQNAELIAPGVHFKDLTFKGHQLNNTYKKQQYSCRFHGVGLCDEFPLIAYSEDYEEGAFDYVLQPGMTLCVEALISRENGDFSIKLEDQLLVTESGYENLTSYPFDKKFLN